MSSCGPASGGADDLQLAGVLCRGAGLAAPRAAEQLSGGRNNRVARIDLRDGSRVVLKRYHRDPRDTRDRLAAEWSFLGYACERGIAAVPRPLARDIHSHAALYSFAAGRKLRPGEVDTGHVSQALDLVSRLNALPRDPLRLAPGSEACFSLADHVATIERRVSRVQAIDADAPHAASARAFVERDLQPAWLRVRQRLMDEAGAARFLFEASLSPAETCVSPSDFGYHNALIDDGGRLTFIDFEYAGRDDPAKLVCDFFCQPEVPVPIGHFEMFAHRIVDALRLDASHTARMRALLDAYRVKWICIMLNEFMPVDAARRAFAEPDVRVTRCREQLDKALTALAVVNSR